MKSFNTMTVAKRKARLGRYFILPFTIGFILFFLQPLMMSLYYSFSNITFGQKGMNISWLGLENFQFLLFRDVDFLPTLSYNLRQMAVQVPIIILFSMFIATMLNQKFKGRGFTRAIFFLPVIVSSGIIISIMKQDVFNQSITSGSAQTSYIFQSTGIKDILNSMSLPTAVINYLTDIINSIFDMMWKAGVQILIFLAAIQSVPAQLYEAANIEGATSWESFWKITFPIVSPMILVNIIYSIVDSFTDYNNSMMQMIMRVGFNNVRYSYACAMAWLYLLVILLVIGFISLFINRFVFYRSE